MNSGGVELLTCSMARDLQIFGVLARSVDACVAGDIRHTVVVPGRDLPEFRQFKSPAREIIAQEDVLPMRLFALPQGLSRLAPLHGALRRPLYITPKLHVMRGWMIQQIVKIDYARQTGSRAIVHVDSDVFFIRPMTATDVLHDGKVAFFRVPEPSREPMHRQWTAAAAACLGLGPAADASAAGEIAGTGHYIENCVPWSSDVVRAMIRRIEDVHGRPYHEVLLTFPSISEYFIYGLFADLLYDRPGLEPADRSLCNSFWPEQPDSPFDLNTAMAQMKPWHRALAVQSTHGFPPTERERAFRAALAHGPAAG